MSCIIFDSWAIAGRLESKNKIKNPNHATRFMPDNHLLRLEVLPEGYVYPRADRPVRDLLRKRSQLVRHRTTNLLSIQNLF